MNKRIISLTLALVLCLGLAIPAFAAGGTAYASTQYVEVDGKKIEFQMYALKDANGNPTNYVKLRDVAHVLSGTPAQFAVGYDGSISVTTGEAYADTGAEMTTPYSGDRAYRTGSGAVLVDGQTASLESIVLTDDHGGDYTYFKLRDLGAALGFTVDWTADRGVIVSTGSQTDPSTCIHNWVTRHVEEVGHYESDGGYHWAWKRVCTCGLVMEIDRQEELDAWQQHIRETRHSYSENPKYQVPNDPHYVVDTPAHDETYCSICGAVK